MKQNKVHIVPHTHWDREWRYPIWKSRSLLVDFIDNLLRVLKEQPTYSQYLLDGQSVVIEDYLKVRPERRAEVEQYIKEGRITCGPWYNLPDLYPLDGECLVRNLLRMFAGTGVRGDFERSVRDNGRLHGTGVPGLRHRVVFRGETHHHQHNGQQCHARYDHDSFVHLVHRFIA